MKWKSFRCPIGSLRSFFVGNGLTLSHQLHDPVKAYFAAGVND